MKALFRSGLIFCFYLLSLVHLKGQNDQQLWLNFVTDYEFNASLLLDTEIAFNQSLDLDDKWYELAFTPILEYYPIRNIDIIAGSAFSYVNQTDTLSSFEVRPILGARFHITPKSRFYVRYLLRYEHRFFNYFENDTRSNTDRIRNRIELITSLTSSSYYSYTNLYLITDFELYTQLGDVPSERFLYQNRFRLGLGYKLNPRWKFEYLIIRQASRNTIEENPSDNIDLIHRFFFKFYPKSKLEK